MFGKGSQRPLSPASAWIAALILGLSAGCKTANWHLPVDLGPANGRADRSYEEPIGRVIPAVFKALDDYDIGPLTVRFRDDLDETSTDIPDAIDLRKNSRILKEHKLLETEEIVLPDGTLKPFKVGSMTYQGFSSDGKRVFVTVKAVAENQTEVSTRFGLVGDELKGRGLLDSLTGRLEAEWKIPDPEANKPIKPFRRKLPSNS